MLLSDRIKRYEAVNDSILTPNLPVILRLDGNSFHQWTRGCVRPYDKNLQQLFNETTKFLIDKTHALVGYTQSDEISLLLYNGGHSESSIVFDGRVNKLNSVVASMCSAFFNSKVVEYLPEKIKNLAFFDCRCFVVANEAEAVNTLLWRQMDASRNSISMLAQHYFSHAELQNKNSKEMQEMLWQKHKINWNDEPSRFKRGAFFRRELVKGTFSIDELNLLPPLHNAHKNPSLVFERHIMREIDLPPLQRIQNRTDVIFRSAEPVLITLKQC
jgi:tRNA(His) guanylyltransferase